MPKRRISAPKMTVEVTASPKLVTEPSGQTTLTVAVANRTRNSAVTLSALNDDILGDLDGQGDCTLPQIIDIGDSYECSVPVTVAGSAGDVVTHVITATAINTEGVAGSASHEAKVWLVSANPVDVWKLAKAVRHGWPDAVSEVGFVHPDTAHGQIASWPDGHGPRPTESEISDALRESYREDLRARLKAFVEKRAKLIEQQQSTNAAHRKQIVLLARYAKKMRQAVTRLVVLTGHQADLTLQGLADDLDTLEARFKMVAEDDAETTIEAEIDAEADPENADAEALIDNSPHWPT